MKHSKRYEVAWVVPNRAPTPLGWMKTTGSRRTKKLHADDLPIPSTPQVVEEEDMPFEQRRDVCKLDDDGSFGDHGADEREAPELLNADVEAVSSPALAPSEEEQQPVGVPYDGVENPEVCLSVDPSSQQTDVVSSPNTGNEMGNTSSEKVDDCKKGVDALFSGPAEILSHICFIQEQIFEKPKVCAHCKVPFGFMEVKARSLVFTPACKVKASFHPSCVRERNARMELKLKLCGEILKFGRIRKREMKKLQNATTIFKPKQQVRRTRGFMTSDRSSKARSGSDTVEHGRQRSFSKSQIERKRIEGKKNTSRKQNMTNNDITYRASRVERYSVEELLRLRTKSASSMKPSKLTRERTSSSNQMSGAGSAILPSSDRYLRNLERSVSPVQRRCGEGLRNAESLEERQLRVRSESASDRGRKSSRRKRRSQKEDSIVKRLFADER